MMVEAHRDRSRLWFERLRDALCGAFEALEPDGARFVRRSWRRRGGGGGVTAVMRGTVFEKVGVNVSTVFGTFPEGFRDQIPGAGEDPRSWASGVSVVAHPASPHVPAAHMNTRRIETTSGWFGGGADLTPTFPERSGEDAEAFHGALRAACDAHGPGDYPRFKAWCDEYFRLPHRGGEARGAGGIFFDNLASGDGEADFAFVRAVGEAFLEAYPAIVRARMDLPWTDGERRSQLRKRGRYVEFNLLHDRGTRFGLMTGGDTEAILMSLPPLVAWE